MGTGTRMRLALAAALVGAVAAAVPAAAQTMTYALDPPYREGVNGANGWYRVRVAATYTCTPSPGGSVADCPRDERFESGTGADGPVVRTATFLPEGPFSVTLESAPGVPLRVDTDAPPQPTLRVPPVRTRGQAATVYDAGSTVLADYACTYGDNGSGPAPVDGCAGPVPPGSPIDTGTADVAATWGTRTFRVIATDAAGNTRSRSVSYTVDELPGPPVPTGPGAGSTVGRRPTLTWNAPADDGSGLSLYRVRVTPEGRSARTYEVAEGGAAVAFTVPEDLPLGPVTWDVTFVDVRNRTAVAAAQRFTVASRPAPGAPRVTTAPGITSEPRPLFAWEPAEAGGSFTWEIAAAGQRVRGPEIADGPSARPADPLTPGDYVFRVRQVTELGGAGPWSPDTPFTVVAPPSPAPTTTVARRAVLAPLPTRNATRLRPRAGVRVSARPVLRWSRVRGATLYNVQVFRVVGRRYVKVASLFPRGTVLRLPAGTIRPRQRYVWRVWPYVGGATRYTRSPLGISWFRR